MSIENCEKQKGGKTIQLDSSFADWKMDWFYSIVKDSNADLTVGNWESKIEP